MRRGSPNYITVGSCVLASANRVHAFERADSFDRANVEAPLTAGYPVGCDDAHWRRVATPTRVRRCVRGYQVAICGQLDR